MSDVRAYCSWCYKKTKHQLEEESLISRDIYQCCSCKNYTLKCRYCSEMARGKPSDDTTDPKHTQVVFQSLCSFGIMSYVQNMMGLLLHFQS